MRKKITHLLYATIFFVGFCAHGQIVTSTADDGSPGTLRNQIEAALPGGIITFGLDVSNITLLGQITIDKSIIITGNGIVSTTVNGGAVGRIFNITSGDVVINDLSLTNGLADNGGAIQVANASLLLSGVDISNSTANGASGSGGAILLSTGSEMTATNSTFRSNVANRAGGAIEMVAGTELTLTNSDFELNNAGLAPATAAPGNGGAIHITGMGMATINGGTFLNNKAAAEGGALWNGSGTMEINDATIMENMASGVAPDNGGGGIYNLNGGTLNINNTDIKNNQANGTAGSGGGILNDVGSILNITNSEISGNTSNRAGGGIENNAGMVMMTNVILNTNTTFTSPGNGGGLHVTGAGTVTITGGEINDNTAGSEGGGLWNGTGTMTIIGTTISGNTASGNAADNGGGGIYNFNGGTLMIDDATISDNVADGTLGSGGGILNDVGSQLTVRTSIISGNTAVRAGGGIEDNSGTSTIILTDVNLDNNSATGPPGNGGGLHITGGGNVTITGGTANGNSASLEGGGLWNGVGIMTITDTEIVLNDATGNAADDGGGGIFNNGGTVAITNSVIMNNFASGTAGSGGGLFSIAGAVTILNSTFEFNGANRAGGAIEVVTGTLSLTDTDLLSNDVNGNAGAPAPGNGGGIHISGITTTMISGGLISGNGARREGGGLWNQTGSEMIINNVTIDDNYAMGLEVTHGGGGIFVNGGTVTINSSTISNNETRGNGLGNGGGIHVKAGGVANVTVSTISRNGSVNNGGGIYNNGSLFINASTIATNTAEDFGGGIANEAPVQLTLKNSIVALNTSNTGADVAGTGEFTSLGYNLIGKDDQNVFRALDSDLEGTSSAPINPLVGPLANNGGTTMTHQLLAESPAYNAGDPMDSFFNDQINSPIFGGIRDIGAYEAQSQLGIDTIAFNNKVSTIYPNPAINGSINIRLADTFASEVNGRLIDLGTGKLVKKFKVASAETDLNISEFATGIYAIVLTSADFSETHKLIITK